MHLWHGDMKRRGYARRWKMLIDHGFDPDADLELDENRLWAWTAAAHANRPRMIAAIKNHFSRPSSLGPIESGPALP
jgi:hypothetical protein